MQEILDEPEPDAKRDEALLRAVVEIALDPLPFGVAYGKDALAGLRQLHHGAPPLGDDRRQAQRRERRERDVQLQLERAVGGGMLGERPQRVRCDPDPDHDGYRDRQGRSLRAEAQRGPEQRREDQIGQRLIGGQRADAQRRHRGDRERQLQGPAAP